MSSARSNKRKRRYDTAQPTVEDTTLFKGWVDEGTAGSNGRINHEGFTILLGDDLLVLSLGDNVLMRTSSEPSDYADDEDDYYSTEPSKFGKDMLIARIESVWEERKSRRSLSRTSHQHGGCYIGARWYMKKKDALSEPSLSSQPFASDLTEHDLILSNQVDKNPITSICGDVQVICRRPEDDKVLPPLPTNVYVRRYDVDFPIDSDDLSKPEVTPYQGESFDWGQIILASPSNDDISSKRSRLDQDDSQNEEKGDTLKPSNSSGDLLSNDTSSSIAMSSSDAESESSADQVKKGGALDPPGNSEKRNIRVGEEHQAVVPPYEANEKVESRNPTLVWKHDRISDDKVDAFFAGAANILTPLLRDRRFVHEHPYSPLSWDRMESLVSSLGDKTLPTLSSVCTASSLSKTRSLDVLREYDVDRLLTVLHDKGYDTKAALAAIQKTPMDFITAWSVEEKELFDSGFRRYSGSLRMIGKGISPSKCFNDVIDYHYRFKIPDQFRRFQDKKREQAVRMIECIETRRNIHAPINANGDRNQIAEGTQGKRKTKESEWFKVGISDVTGDLQDRRVNAKRLLLDIESRLGGEKLFEVVEIIKQMNREQPMPELKVRLMELLKDDKRLQQRFLEYLPGRY